MHLSVEVRTVSCIVLSVYGHPEMGSEHVTGVTLVAHCDHLVIRESPWTLMGAPRGQPLGLMEARSVAPEHPPGYILKVHMWAAFEKPRDNIQVLVTAFGDKSALGVERLTQCVRAFVCSLASSLWWCALVICLCLQSRLAWF